MTLREEFRLKNFGFSGVSTDRFFSSQWRIPGIAYLLYRIATAGYTMTILVITALHQNNHGHGHIHSGNDTIIMQHWAAYLTNWTYILLTLYHMLHALFAIGIFTCCTGGRRPCFQRVEVDEHVGMFHEFESGRDDLGAEDSDVTRLSSDVTYFQPPARWHVNLLWILLNMSSAAAFMVTLVFWAILVPTMGNGKLGELSDDNLQLHLVNTILVLLEHSVSAAPVRILHVIYPFIYGLIYMFFSLFYWIPDHSHIMYDILDWGKPETAGYIILVGFVIMPFLHLLLYLIYRLKLKIFSCVHRL